MLDLWSVFPLLLLTTATCTFANPVPSLPKRHSSGIPFSSRSIEFNGRVARSTAAHPKHSKRWYGQQKTLTGVLGGYTYTLPITIGSQEFTVELDTGSPDLWSPPYDPGASPSFQDQSSVAHYNQSYVAGASYGPVGLDDVTVGNLTVPGQLFAYVEGSTTGLGKQGLTDGILGMAWPDIGKVFKGPLSESGTDLFPNTSYFYETWFFNAVNKSLVDPYFSITLNKPSYDAEANLDNTSTLGSLTLRGISPDVPFSDISVTAPNVGIPVNKNLTAHYWGAAIESFSFPGAEVVPSANKSTPYALFDTGTLDTLLPAPLVEAWHNAISPPGNLSNATGTPTWSLKCDAEVVDLVMTIGGVDFTANGENFIHPSLSASDTPTTEPGCCISLLQPENSGNVVIGDSFLWDLITIHDVSTNELTVVQRSDV